MLSGWRQPPAAPSAGAASNGSIDSDGLASFDIIVIYVLPRETAGTTKARLG